MIHSILCRLARRSAVDVTKVEKLDIVFESFSKSRFKNSAKQRSTPFAEGESFVKQRNIISDWEVQLRRKVCFKIILSAPRLKEKKIESRWMVDRRMKAISKHFTVLELLVLLFLGQGFLLSRITSAFVSNRSVLSLYSKTSTMYASSNHEDRENKATGNVSPEETTATVPLVDIGSSDHEESTTSIALVNALQDSGFAIIRSPLMTKELQSSALKAASAFLKGSKGKNLDASPLVEAIEHPTDPKVYSMLDSNDQFDFVSPDCTIKEYVRALRSIKMEVLRLIAIGLGMSNVEFFAKLHDEDNDTLRLITYHPTHSEETGNRCKEHSDYGTITLLSTDGVSGLELFRDGKWLPVPYVEGALVINVGSLMSGWTRGSLKATLHRVAGPASKNSCSDRKILLEAIHWPRTSLAFFADPNKNVSESLQATAGSSEDSDLIDALGGMSVEEYISWRSGGDGAERSGVSFTEKENERIKKPS